jgi:hypothetical protein
VDLRTHGNTKWQANALGWHRKGQVHLAQQAGNTGQDEPRACCAGRLSHDTHLSSPDCMQVKQPCVQSLSRRPRHARRLSTLLAPRFTPTAGEHQPAEDEGDAANGQGVDT